MDATLTDIHTLLFLGILIVAFGLGAIKGGQP